MICLLIFLPIYFLFDPCEENSCSISEECQKVPGWMKHECIETEPTTTEPPKNCCDDCQNGALCPEDSTLSNVTNVVGLPKCMCICLENFNGTHCEIDLCLDVDCGENGRCDHGNCKCDEARV